MRTSLTFTLQLLGFRFGRRDQCLFSTFGFKDLSLLQTLCPQDGGLPIGFSLLNDRCFKFLLFSKDFLLQYRDLFLRPNLLDPDLFNSNLLLSFGVGKRPGLVRLGTLGFDLCLNLSFLDLSLTL